MSDLIRAAQQAATEAAAGGSEYRLAVIDRAEVRASDDEAVAFQFSGHAAVFNSRSEDLGFREVIKPGAFRKSLQKADDVRLLFNHDPNYVLARTTSGTLKLSEDPRGLLAEAQIAPVSYAKDLRILLDRGDISQMSFAFSMRDGGRDEWSQEPDGTVLRTIHEFGSTSDVSIVTYPAYTKTDAQARELQRVFTSPSLTPEQRGLLQDLLSIPAVEAEGAAATIAELGGSMVSTEQRTDDEHNATLGEPEKFRLAAAQRRLKQRMAFAAR